MARRNQGTFRLSPDFLLYYRARYYDPSLGRFLSEDRHRFEQGSNFYRYVQNNPVQWVDPSGNSCWLRTPNDFIEVPCANECIGNSCNVTPTGPPPSPAPGHSWDNDLELMDEMSKCNRKKAEEIIDIWGEAANESANSLPWLPGKSLGLQVVEHTFEHAGFEGAGHILPFVDLGFYAFDAYENVQHYYDFKKKLKDVQESECGCEQKSKNK